MSRLPVPRRPGEVVLAVALLANLVPLVVATPLTTTDGPAHVLSAVVVDAADAPVYAAHYALRWRPVPNLLATVLLAGLVRLADPTLAEKLLVGGFVLALPAALWWALVGIRRDAGYLAALALPLGWGYLTWYGFYGFGYGLVGFAVVAGLAVRSFGRAGAWRTAALAAALVATWFAHLVPFALAALLVAALAAADARRRRAWAPVGWAAAALAPAVALTGLYATYGGAPLAPRWIDPAVLVGELLVLWRPLVGLSGWDAAAAVLAALALAGATAAALRARPRRPDGWSGARGGLLAALAGSALLAVAVPDALGPAYGFLSDRLAYFPPLLLALWLATHPLGARTRAAVLAGLLAAAAVVVAAGVPVQRSAARAARQYAELAGEIRPGSVLLAVRVAPVLRPAGGLRNSHWDLLAHAPARLAARTRSLDVGHYVAEQPYFPTAFCPAHDLRRLVDPTLTGLERVPPRIALTDPRAREIDDVIVVGADRAPLPAGLRSQLTRWWAPVARSGDGLLTLWARRPGVPVPSSAGTAGCRGQ